MIKFSSYYTLAKLLFEAILGKKKYSLDDCKKIAAERGGKCLSSHYSNIHTKMTWECEHKEIWEASFANVKRSSWCPHSCCDRRKEGISSCIKAAASKGGKCLSATYQNIHTPMLWECSEGHVWETSYKHIKSGSWCPACKTNNIHLCQKVASSFSGKCLSEEYKNSREKMLWECEKGHVWEATFHSVKQGKWCPHEDCLKTRSSIDSCRKLIESRGGRLLSTQYTNQHSKMLWECSNKHVFSASFNELKNGKGCGNKLCDKRRVTVSDCLKLAARKGGRFISKDISSHNEKLLWSCSCKTQFSASYKEVSAGKWCPVCLDYDGQFSLINCKKLAASLSGRCLSKKYNHKKELLWQCHNGKQWFENPKRVNAGTWCPECDCKPGLDKILRLQKLAISKSGKLLSKIYHKAKSKLLWQCEKDHLWEASANAIQNGKWCPICADGKSETLCREILEDLLSTKFTKQRPAWLKNPLTGRVMELDGFSTELKLAFEYHGKQHFERIPYFHKTREAFHSQRQRDAAKKRICKKQGIILIVIPYFPRPNNKKHCKNWVIKALKKKNITI